MIMISSRTDFWESDNLSDFDLFRDVNLSDESLGTEMTRDEVIKKISGKTILVLIHGYNSEPDDVIKSYQTLEENFKDWQFYDEIVGYTWPGGDNPFDYQAAKSRSSAVARRLQMHLNSIFNNAVLVDLMTHSMGSRVALSALDDGKKQKVVNNLFLTASAVDNEDLEFGNQFFSSTQKCNTVYVFHSKHDPVLNLGYRVHHWDSALGLFGPENPATLIEKSPNVKVVNCKNHIKRHGGYKDCKELYTYLKNEFFTTNKHPQYYTL
ncbi:MAG: alpha/beta hydrolase [Chloroherpetonaceae bacterium]|nr:alpha/beta hydrolase [Chloroherpetonaceae bacterium]